MTVPDQGPLRDLIAGWRATAQHDLDMGPNRALLDCADALEAALQASLNVTPGGWQPIATVPPS